MTAPVAPLAAGQLTEFLTLQSLSESVSGGVITPTWSDYATAWAAPGPTALLEQLPGEQSKPRIKGVFFLRRREAPLPLPLRILNRGRTMFARAEVPDLLAQDRTVLYWEDGIDMTVGSGGSVGAAEAVTVYRNTPAAQDDGSTKPSWASVATAIALRMDDADATILDRDFGRETQSTVRGTAPIETDLRLGDGVIVTAGRHLGQRFFVSARRIDPTLPGQAYWSLALSLTEESFT